MSSLFANIVRGIMRVTSLLPLRVHYFFGGIASWIMKNVMHYRSDVVMINLSRSFPEKKYRELKDISSKFYNHMGEIIAETIWVSGSSEKRVRKQRIVKVVNPEHLCRVYENSPSMTVLSTHCGNWELMGAFFGYETENNVKFPFTGENITVVYKKLTNKTFDEVFKRNRVHPLGEAGKNCAVESSNVLRYTLKHKDMKKIYVYPTDQAPYHNAAKYHIGEFMHQQSNAMLGSVGVACKLSHSVMYMKMKHVSRGRYEMSFITICEDASKSTPEEIMRKYYDLLQEEINETPHNWLWSHKRWK